MMAFLRPTASKLHRTLTISLILAPEEVSEIFMMTSSNENIFRVTGR